MSGPRYALYYLPRAEDGLYRFGSALLGYDAFGGSEIEQPAETQEAFADWKMLTEEPRRYGFHATLKAPINLAPGTTEDDIVKAFQRFVQAPRPIPTITPVVRMIGPFIAVVPNAPVAGLNQLANDCVRDFDGLRAPLSEDDRQRRLRSPLTPRQIEHLERWGYPYVFEEFRFHMTLTGALPRDRQEPTLAFLQHRFAKLDRNAQPIDHLALLRQDNPTSRFVMLKHARLAAAD